MGKHGKHQQTAASSRRVSRMVLFGGVVALAALLAIGLAVLAGRSQEEAAPSLAAVSAAESPVAKSALPVVDVYKTPTCGCCSKWVDHLREEGFEVRTTDMRDLTEFRASHGVPREIESCHTALVAGYVLEGHVPARDIQRLSRERPAIAGVAVPGMPIGSPGMEVPGANAQPYEVIAFRNDGSTHVFARHGR